MVYKVSNGVIPWRSDWLWSVTLPQPRAMAIMISATFARPNGLSRNLNGKKSCEKAMRFYQLSIFVIVPLMMSLITLNTIVTEGTPTVGRFAFAFYYCALL